MPPTHRGLISIYMSYHPVIFSIPSVITLFKYLRTHKRCATPPDPSVILDLEFHLNICFNRNHSFATPFALRRPGYANPVNKGGHAARPGCKTDQNDGSGSRKGPKNRMPISTPCCLPNGHEDLGHTSSKTAWHGLKCTACHSSLQQTQLKRRAS